MSNQENGQMAGIFPYIPKQKRAQQKRKSLLDSGRELFSKYGYEHTTAKEIASHAGVAIGTFYRYFSDKRQLLMALLEDKLDKILPPEPSWINNDPVNYLADKLAEHYEQLDKMGLHKVLPEFLLRNLELADIVEEARRKRHDKILASLQKAKEKGLTWTDIDLDTVAWSILVLFEHIPKAEKETGVKTNYSELSKLICRMVFPPEVIAQLKRGTFKHR